MYLFRNSHQKYGKKLLQFLDEVQEEQMNIIFKKHLMIQT